MAECGKKKKKKKIPPSKFEDLIGFIQHSRIRDQKTSHLTSRQALKEIDGSFIETRCLSAKEKKELFQARLPGHLSFGARKGRGLIQQTTSSLVCIREIPD